MKKERRLIDTNLIVRHLVQDHPEHSRAAARLFESCDHGHLVLILLPSVLAECIFVLESFYQHPRGDIARVLGGLITSPGIELDELEVHCDALQRYGSSSLHFVDCTVAASAAARKLRIASFDRGFRKFPDISTAIDAP